MYLVQADSPVTSNSLPSRRRAFIGIPLSGAYSMTWAAMGQIGVGTGGTSHVSVTAVVLTAITSRPVGAATDSVYV